MAKLIITLEGATVEEKVLETTQEYILGRGTQCDIVLNHVKVSRQHAKIFFDGQNWICKLISKFGFLEVNNHPVEDLTLSEGIRLKIEPFDIRFTENSLINNIAVAPQDGDVGDHTYVGSITLKAVLRKLDNMGQFKSEYVINQPVVTAGRSSSCEVQIDDAHASRRHFSITYDGRHYTLRDLESANKTYVNNEPVTEHILQSGDEIIVGDERHRFEIVNPEFENLPALVTTPYQGGYPSQHLGPAPAVIKYTPPNQIKIFLGQINSSKNAKIKTGVILSILILVIYGALSGSNQKPGARGVASGGSPVSGGTAYEKLPAEQKKFIDETYNLALNLYTTGKYDLAAVEVGKILNVVTNYKDAKNILALCQQAQEIKRQQDESDRMRKDQEGVHQKVTEILDGCEILYKQKKFSQVEGCVSQVSELDPDNERALSLSTDAKAALENISNVREERVEHARLRSKVIKTFAQAQKDLKAKRYPAALSEFQQVERVAINDPTIKEKAKSGVTVVKEQMLKESQALVQAGKAAFDSKEYGDAVLKFNKALQYAPFNTEARELREKAKSERHQDMKNTYSESVIEENLGNIESAKKKWSNIIKEGDSSDPYYEKAQLKLRKYEK